MPSKKKEPARGEVLIQLVENNKIWVDLLNEMPVLEIAKKYNCTEENITQIMTKWKNQLTADQIDMQQRFLAVTLAQTGRVLHKVLDAIERQTTDENDKKVGPSPAMLKAALDIWKYREKLAIPETSPDGDGNTKVQILQTFNYDSPLGKKALQLDQTAYMGTTVHGVDEPTVVELDSAMKRLSLSELASTYVPDEEEDVE